MWWTQKSFKEAKEAGRVCDKCGFTVSKKRWNKGLKVCSNCEDAAHGVNISTGYLPYADEPMDKTGEM
jgi:ribosomal protein L37AE/L43A